MGRCGARLIRPEGAQRGGRRRVIPPSEAVRKLIKCFQKPGLPFCSRKLTRQTTGTTSKRRERERNRGKREDVFFGRPILSLPQEGIVWRYIPRRISFFGSFLMIFFQFFFRLNLPCRIDQRAPPARQLNSLSVVFFLAIRKPVGSNHPLKK